MSSLNIQLAKRAITLFAQILPLLKNANVAVRGEPESALPEELQVLILSLKRLHLDSNSLKNSPFSVWWVNI